MKEKLKIFVPLVLVGAIVSCDKNNNDIRLKRETYNDKITTTMAFANMVKPLRELQFKEINNVGYYSVQIPNQGTVTANTSLNFTGDKIYFSYHEKSKDPVKNANSDILFNRENIDEKSTTQTTISWNIDGYYLKVDDHKTAVSYVVKDPTNNIFWWCVSPMDGSSKYRKDITEYIAADYDYLFNNFVFDSITYNLTEEIEIEDLIPALENPIRAGFDISGFIGPTRTSSFRTIGVNVLSPMSLLTYQINDELDASLLVDAARLLLEPMGVNLHFASSSDLAQNAYCLELGLGDLYLSDIKKTYDSEIIQMLLGMLAEYGGNIALDKSDGTANFNFFLNYKNNFIHQEEFIANLKNINFDLIADYTPIKSKLNDSNQLDLLANYRDGFTIQFDIKNINLSYIANQEMVETCSVDSINIEDFPVATNI